MRRFLRARLPVSAEALMESAKIRKVLLKWLLPRPPCIIAAFSPLPGEVDLPPLFSEASAFHWVLPRVKDTMLTFHTANLEGLRPGSFGIAEPEAAAPAVPLEEISLFLCPGLGFSPNGARIGRGKGFYDRALERSSPDAKLVGIAFGSQIVPNLPMESHDRPMNWLATAEGMIHCE